MMNTQRNEQNVGLPHLATVLEAFGLFSDAAVADKLGNLFFISLWGRDTVIQEFLAKLTLSTKEGGIRSVTIEWMGSRYSYSLSNIESFNKQTGRTAANTVLGPMVQLWLYQEVLEKPELVAGRAALLNSMTETENVENRLWNLLRKTSKIPLLPHWQKRVLKICRENGWIQFNSGFCIDLYLIELPDAEFEGIIGDEIRTQRLTEEEPIKGSINV
jgi:hypothetical protein